MDVPKRPPLDDGALIVPKDDPAEAPCVRPDATPTEPNAPVLVLVDWLCPNKPPDDCVGCEEDPKRPPELGVADTPAGAVDPNKPPVDGMDCV